MTDDSKGLYLALHETVLEMIGEEQVPPSEIVALLLTVAAEIARTQRNSLLNRAAFLNCAGQAYTEVSLKEAS